MGGSHGIRRRLGASRRNRLFQRSQNIFSGAILNRWCRNISLKRLRCSGKATEWEKLRTLAPRIATVDIAAQQNQIPTAPSLATSITVLGSATTAQRSDRS